MIIAVVADGAVQGPGGAVRSLVAYHRLRVLVEARIASRTIVARCRTLHVVERAVWTGNTTVSAG